MQKNQIQVKEVNWSEINREESEMACLVDFCCWKEAD